MPDSSGGESVSYYAARLKWIVGRAQADMKMACADMDNFNKDCLLVLPEAEEVEESADEEDEEQDA